MKIPRRQCLGPAGAALAIMLATLSSHGAWAQARAVKIVVPYAPGGAADSLARLLAEQFGRTQGQAMVVENRPGAGTVIGTEAVSRAAPDGTTVLIVSNSFLINAHVRKLSYDPLTSFEPICNLVQSPGVFAVTSASPYRTLGDLLAAARTKPGALTMAASGPGTGFHIGFEQLKRMAKVDLTFVPFTGSAPAVNALLGEHVTSAFADYNVVSEHIKAGKLRALAFALRTRLESLADVPTVTESGFDDYEADLWYGLVAPAGTAKETLAQFADRLTAAVQVSEIKARLVAIGLYPVGLCGTAFGAHLRKQYETYGRIIREANIKAE